jgi:hypothetical protein
MEGAALVFRGDPAMEAAMRKVQAEGFARQGSASGHFVDSAMIDFVNRAQG